MKQDLNKNFDFGYERVTKEEKTEKVGAVFDSVSQKYDNRRRRCNQNYLKMLFIFYFL